jgi:periplasmic protein TonB
MTVTVKDSSELTSPVKPGLPSQSSGNKPSDSARPNPVCLEVPVTVRSLPGENGNVPSSSGPTREEGRTVIVFDNGAVLRLSNNLPSGQKVILSNAQGRDVVCRVVKGTNLPTVKGYIEVEFIEQVNDFWHIHQNAEPVRVSPPPIPILASLQPIPVVPLAAAPVVPRGGARDKEMASPLGSAPTFEDIAGLVGMSPPSSAPVRTSDAAARMGAARSKSEGIYSQRESAKSITSISGPSPISDVTSGKGAIPAAQEFSSEPVPRPARSNDFMARGMLASGQMSAVSTPGGFRRRLPLIAGGAALVFAGFGAGYYLMHQGNAPASASSAVVAVQHSGPVSPVINTPVEPVQISQPAREQAPAQPQPVSTIASAISEPAVSTSSDNQNIRRAPSNPDVKQTDAPSKPRQQLPNLKMSSPSAPRQNLVKLSEGAAPSVTDVSSAMAVGGASPATMLAPVVRSEIQPAPPSLGSSAPSGKVVREPKLISSTHPMYPSVARQANTQGNVVVSAEVDAKGNVTAAKAISGPASLRQAAADAVSHWKYSPALIDGKPASSQVTVDIQFRLN